MIRKKDTSTRFLAVVSVIIIVLLLALSSWPMSSTFRATGTSGEGGTVVVTGTYATGYFTSYTTTNAAGQAVTTQAYVTTTTSGAYATTTQYATTTTGTQPESWLVITIEGIANLLNPQGGSVGSQTFEIEPLSGGGIADAIALQAQYSVDGQGIDWSTLKVDCSSTGATYQPSASNPDQPETVNAVTLKQWLGQTARSGQLAVTSKISELTGGRSWDHGLKLTAGVGVICTATAKKLPGYSLVGGDEVTATVGPIVVQSHLKWTEPAPVTPVSPTTPTAPTTRTTTTKATTSPSTTYSTNTAGNLERGARERGGGKEAAGGTRQGIGVRGGVLQGRSSGGYELLGLFTPTLEIWGADSVDSMPLVRFLSPFVATAIGVTVLFLLFKRGKKRRM